MNRDLRTSRLILLLLLLSVAASPVRAQWKNVAPGLLDVGRPQDFNGGAVAFKGGNLWVGLFGLFLSTDLGKTWTNHDPWPSGMGGEIWDIDFLTSLDGVVTSGAGVFVTHDGGMTWMLATIAWSGQDGAYSAFFLGTPNDIAVAAGSSGIFVSRDGGVTWTAIPVARGSVKTYGRWVTGSTSYMIAEDQAQTVNQLYVTNDFGATWAPTPAPTYVDCWSFAVDSCDPTKVYVMNEAGVVSNFPNGDLSAVFVSTDLGTTWTTPYTPQRIELCGSITASQNALFAQTMTKGILRSTDGGATWRSIGGPKNFWDTRFVIAANDNVVFAVDGNDGSVWRTLNSGGDSLALPQTKAGGLKFTDDSLFNTDSLLACGSEIVRPLHFRTFGCIPPQLGSITILDSTNYYYAITQGDSINVTFHPMSGGAPTKMSIKLSDGTYDTIYLVGTVKPSKPLTIAAVDQATDTIGGTVYVPITAAGLDAPRDLELVVRYDPSLRYIGSYSAANVLLDIPGERWAGRSKIYIAGATSGVVLGHVVLDAYPDSVNISHVYFDSVVVTNPDPPCEYAYAGILPLPAAITPPSGCGDQIITNFLLNGTMPSLTIRPNPAANRIELESDRSLGTVTVDILDELGATRLSCTRELTAGQPRAIDVGQLAAGTYHVRVSNGATVSSSALTIVR